MGELGQTKVEIGKVDQDDQVRSLSIEGRLQFPEDLQNEAELEKDLRNPHDGEGLGMVEEPHPSALHGLASHTHELDLWIEALDRFHQMAAMEVSRDLSGNHEDLLRSQPLSLRPVPFPLIRIVSSIFRTIRRATSRARFPSLPGIQTSLPRSSHSGGRP